MGRGTEYWLSWWQSGVNNMGWDWLQTQIKRQSNTVRKRRTEKASHWLATVLVNGHGVPSRVTKPGWLEWPIQKRCVWVTVLASFGTEGKDIRCFAMIQRKWHVPRSGWLLDTPIQCSTFRPSGRLKSEIVVNVYFKNHSYLNFWLRKIGTNSRT